MGSVDIFKDIVDVIAALEVSNAYVSDKCGFKKWYITNGYNIGQDIKFRQLYTVCGELNKIRKAKKMSFYNLRERVEEENVVLDFMEGISDLR